ncbi:hypothetical protein ONE63_008900 [Megalurothrips usitatus]|uniref:Mannosyltransferase n=1 Tax=Megalurothrips usitatus TaxID=439358 RepID=A0AAV7XIT0_9NEOP|nr:hypothetical protein ONE63_008900 [Megalurothrips usitatus]
MQKENRENAPFIPFRATRLWDEAIRLFTNGMPSKRHRSHMRVYENCFTGSEAVKWFHHALEMNPHFNTVVTQEKTMQLLNKFYDEGIFVKAKGSSKERQGPDRFKLQGIYQMGTARPQYTARTPLSVKNNGYRNQKSENWMRKSWHKEPAVEYENLCDMNKQSSDCKEAHATYQNMPPIKPRLVPAESGKQSPATGKVPSDAGQRRTAQHPIQFLKQYSQVQDRKSTQPHPQPYALPETDAIWRNVFLGRLQALLKDVDVSGLFWPCAVIRCQWLEQNCCILDDSSLAKFPPWVTAASSRLMIALGDKNLNRSIVNADIEADVSALDAYFSGLQSPLIPADLGAIFQRVFLHLELSVGASSFKDEDAVSHHSSSVFSNSVTDSTQKPTESLKCKLPPNSCFETAFTSESPVTRIVPQSSFDTLHLPARPSSACSPMKRNMSAPKLLETTGLGTQVPLAKASAYKSSMSSLSNEKFSTISGTRWRMNPEFKSNFVGGSLQRDKQQRIPASSDSENNRTNHSCGKLTVMDKTPPLPPRHLRKPPPVNRNAPKEDKNNHVRSSSGGYINLALQDSFEGAEFNHRELDIEAAMETLQKLMICSQKPPLQHSPRKDGMKSLHVRSASLSQAHPHGSANIGNIRRSQSCWSHDVSNVSLSSYHTAISSSSSSLDSEVPSRESDIDSSNESLNLTAGCEWGWDWGSDAEQTGVAVFRLLMLLVQPQSRAQLQLLLKLMGLLPYQCPYTTLKVLDMFSSFIMQGGDEDVSSRLLGFLVRHQKEIFIPPQELVSEVQRERKAKMKQRFEEQKLTTSQKALAELLDQIIADQKMSSKDKNKKLKMFKESYPHIYSMRFPQPEMVTFKRRNRSILQLARLRSLRASDMAKDFRLFAALRLASVFLVQTAYVPDEYWQSLEVAHKLSFGYGYLTWEWQEGIRSYAYPLVFSGLFKLLAYLGVDNVKILVTAPRILQALITAYADVSILSWIRNPTYGRSPWAKITIVTSWYLFYVGSRTIYNTIEADLIGIAFSLYPWPPSKVSGSSKYLIVGALACVIRPTAAVILLPLFICQIITSSERLSIILKSIIITCFATALVFTVDTYTAETASFSPINFLKANIGRNIASFYGEHPGLWYFTSGIPMLLGAQLLPFLYEVYKIVKGPNRQSYDILMMFVFLSTVLLYSFQPHKETRFLLPLLPIALFWSAGGLSRFEKSSLKENWGRIQGVVNWTSRFLPWLLLISAVVPSLYFGLVHQRGTLDVMPWLSNRAQSCPEKTRILFLMPCHSTPLYSHLHVDVPTRFLTCVPDLQSVPDPGYVDEADLFYADHVSWLNKNFPETKPELLYSHIVYFDSLQQKLEPFLRWGGYSEVASFFHTHLPTERVGRRVIVQERAASLIGCT